MSITYGKKSVSDRFKILGRNNCRILISFGQLIGHAPRFGPHCNMFDKGF